MKRSLLIKIHTFLAGFFFVTALLFLATGGLMTLGLKGEYEKSIQKLQLNQNISENIKTLKKIVASELSKQDISVPRGKTDLETEEGGIIFEWEDNRHTITLEGDIGSTEATLTIEAADGFRYLVNLHKSEGSDNFKALAVAWSFGLLALLVSGLLMAWQSPVYKRLSLQSMCAGVLAFMLAAYFS